MTKQESIFEVAKTLFVIDKPASYKQLKKINFDELRLVFGDRSELESDIKNLTLYIAVTENVYDIKDYNLADEIGRVYSSPNTVMFYDNKSLAGLLVEKAAKLLLVNKQLFTSMNLPVFSTFVPNMDVKIHYTNNSTTPNEIKDDVVKLIALNSSGMLSKERLDAYVPNFNEHIPLLNLKIQFAVRKSLFDYGLLAANLLVEDKGSAEYSAVLSFIDKNIHSRGINDDKLQKLMLKFRASVPGTKDEMLLDKAIFMYEYALSTSGAAKIDLLKNLKLLTTKYSDLGIDIAPLLELKTLKGM